MVVYGSIYIAGGLITFCNRGFVIEILSVLAYACFLEEVHISVDVVCIEFAKVAIKKKMLIHY